MWYDEGMVDPVKPKRAYSSQNRRFTKGLAQEVRDKIHPSLIVEFWAAILGGHDPSLTPDERCEHGYRVTWPERGEHVPDLRIKMEAMVHVRNAGWGLPAQQLLLDADIRQQALVGVIGIETDEVATLPVGQRAAALAAVRLALGGAAVDGAQDVEFTDLPEPGGDSDGDEPSNGLGETDDGLDGPG